MVRAGVVEAWSFSINEKLDWIRDHMNATRLWRRLTDVLGALPFSRCSTGAEADAQALARSLRGTCHGLMGGWPVGVFWKDGTGRYQEVNALFCQIYGLNPERTLGMSDEELLPAALAEKHSQAEHELLGHGGMSRQIETVTRGAGESRQVLVLRSRACAASGIVAGIRGVCVDVTTEELELGALRQDRELLTALMENIPDSVYFKDLDSRFLKCSRAQAVGFGLEDPSGVVGKTDFDFFTEEHAKPAFEDERSIIRTGQAVIGRIERETRPGGQCSWVLTTKMALRDRCGRIIGTFGISKDITALKRVEAELADARDAAEQATRAKSAFLASMSHEIRTPMNGVIGMINLLLDSELSLEQRDFALTVRNSAEALLSVLNDILDYSKMEAGKLSIETLEFDLREVVEETVELLAERARLKNIEVASSIPVGLPTLLLGDPGRLRQILMNLVGNAVKFTERGEVVVNVVGEAETKSSVVIRIEVRDTGIGIPAAAQAQLFQPFTQADGSTTRRYGGTGLGLAISKDLVELMGGTIGLESLVGQGSSFWFSIPFQKQRVGRSLTCEGVPRLFGRRVLVVDDNATNRRIVCQLLQGWQMRCYEVSGASEAIEALRHGQAEGDAFDVAILDMQMPGMDGAGLARTIEADPALRGVRRMMLTSLGQRLSTEEMASGGIERCLSKPVRLVELRNALVALFTPHSSSVAGLAVSMIAPTVSSPEQGQRGRGSVLLVEDNVVNQKVAACQLRKLGCDVHVVKDGLEAIEAMRNATYSVVLMDCEMPRMDGYEATRQIRLLEREGLLHPSTRTPVHIVALTAHAMLGDQEKCIAAGMDEYLSKPVQMSELKGILDRSCPSAG